jgi:thiol-disulfide isomerase/thioredoxin
LATQGQIGGYPPILLQVARLYVERGVALEEVPGLVARALEDDPLEAGSEQKLEATRWEGLGILAHAHIVQGDFEKARGLISDMAQGLEVSGAADRTTGSEGYERYRAELEAVTGHLAYAERRHRDAVFSYMTAIAHSPDAGRREELLVKASALWRELGGDTAAWSSWERSVATESARSESTSWRTVARVLPGFQLQDLHGRAWRLEDLEGRVVFVNVWASWCGPCLAELPEIQKLHDRYRGRADVLVVSMNVDDNPGIVASLVQSHSYSFPVLLGRDYVASVTTEMEVPLNWIVDPRGTLRKEQRGFSYDPEWGAQVVTAVEDVARSLSGR